MAQVNNDSTISLDPNMCDYCHQRPKFPPYDYCGRTCGARAKVVGGQATGPAMCKQCNQRPAYQNHQFCGKNCANAWTVAHGQINTGPLGISWLSSWNQNQQTVQGGSQLGQGRGGIKGFVKGFKNLISPTNQTQQQQTMVNPAQMQQPSSNTTNPTSNVGALTIASPTTVIPSTAPNQLPPGTSQPPPNPPSPTNEGTSGQGSNKQLGPLNGVDPISQPPIQSTSAGSSVPQILDDTDLDPTQVAKPNIVWNGMSPPQYSAGSLGHTSEPDDSNADAILGQSSYQVRDPSENGDDGDGGDEVLVGDMDVQSIGSYVYPPSISASESIGTCRLRGCSNSTFVDSVTDLESEYCSWKHREEAMVSKQATSCVMCLEMPKGPSDHFCSAECRARALCP